MLIYYIRQYKNHGGNVNLFAELALISEDCAHNICISIGNDGKIENVEIGVEPDKNNKKLLNRIHLPAMSNRHRHSFQQSIAGITEKRTKKWDSFWNWRRFKCSYHTYWRIEDA